jgi:hypothetical protein
MNPESCLLAGDWLEGFGSCPNAGTTSCKMRERMILALNIIEKITALAEQGQPK